MRLHIYWLFLYGIWKWNCFWITMDIYHENIFYRNNMKMFLPTALTMNSVKYVYDFHETPKIVYDRTGQSKSSVFCFIQWKVIFTESISFSLCDSCHLLSMNLTKNIMVYYSKLFGALKTAQSAITQQSFDYYMPIWTAVKSSPSFIFQHKTFCSCFARMLRGCERKKSFLYDSRALLFEERVFTQNRTCRNIFHVGGDRSALCDAVAHWITPFTPTAQPISMRGRMLTQLQL